MKSKLEEVVIYLVIVSMPSNEELKEAREQVEAINKGGETSVA